MLPALVHPADLIDIAAGIRRSGARILARPFRSPTLRTQSAWTHTSSLPRQWTDIPLIQERIRTRITGNAQESLPQYVTRVAGPAQNSWRGLSLGCGTGGREVQWMATGAFAVLDAVDLSPSRIAVARQRAEHEGTGGRLRFVAGDVRTIDPAPQSYDIVIFEDALHHFSPMHANLSRARSWLRPGGILVINEFVGPSRFQWTDEQLRAVNKLLEGLPWDLRVRHDGTPKPRVHRPGTLTMRLYDPSEAADSSHIIPAIRSMFDTREEHFYEGTVLHLLCKDIAHHFLTLDAERRSLLESCCDQEDLLIAGGKLTSDFAAIVALNLRGP